MAVLMLSTSSPSTTSTDWAGLKWNWTHTDTNAIRKLKYPDSNSCVYVETQRHYLCQTSEIKIKCMYKNTSES